MMEMTLRRPFRLNIGAHLGNHTALQIHKFQMQHKIRPHKILWYMGTKISNGGSFPENSKLIYLRQRIFGSSRSSFRV